MKPGQIRIVQTARKQLGLEEDDYRALLRRVAYVDSAKKLDNAGFTALMDEFKRLGFKSTSPRKPIGGRRPGFASDQQINLMRRLWDEYTGGKGTEAQLGRFLEAKFKTSSPRFLSFSDAPRVITALRAMVERARSHRGEAE